MQDKHMLDPNLPQTILRDAWCRVRLDAIRTAVDSTLTQLQALSREEALEEQRDDDIYDTARLAALWACSDELREESGMQPDVNAAPSHPSDCAWTEHYEETLRRYRYAAGVSLRGSLDREPTAHTSLDTPS